MRISEEGLRRRIGSDKLIGCYTQKDNGYTCFRDIRGEEGDMVKNPHTSQYDLEIEYNDSNLEVGTFYSFSWHFNHGKTKGKIIREKPKAIQIVNEHYLNRFFYCFKPTARANSPILFISNAIKRGSI